MRASKVGLLAVFSTVTLAMTMVACTIEKPAGENSATSTAAAGAAGEDEKLAPVASVEDGAKDVDPSKPVTVRALEGELEEVVIKNEDGKVIKSTLADDKLSWSTSQDLGFYRTYTITAKGSNGTESVVKFDTATPTATTGVALSPLSDSKVGVGQTIGMRFSTPIQDREAAQKAITVETSPKVDGAFYWLSDYEVRWRPKDYWKPGTKVNVKADIFGADLGGGVFGSEDNEASFEIVGGYRALVDDASKTMTIYDGDQVVRTMPVSLGANKWPTPNGTYIIGDKYPTLVMDSTTYGLAYDQGGYKTEVQYATQMSYSGIYVHGAPWSVWAQGSQNTSHGCINVSIENARWFQENFKRGDIVEVQGTVGGQFSGYDGLGDWNIPWDEWSKGNAKN